MRIDIRTNGTATGLGDPSVEPRKSIDTGKALGSGAQGEILTVATTDGRPVRGLLVKIFAAGFPAPFLDLVETIRTQGPSQNLGRTRSLQALPLFVFDGFIAGRGQVQGYLMRHVAGRAFSDVLDDLTTYLGMPLSTRLLLARHFADAMVAFYNLTVIHADINGQNLLVDLQSSVLNIIDVDGGAVARNGRAPVAIGKMDSGWLAPEIYQKLRQPGTIDVAITADLWSMAAGVHYLLFGVAPFFFLRLYTEIPTYLKQSQWPTTRSLRGVQLQNQHFFGHYERRFGELVELQPLFRRTFQDGFSSPSQRLGASQWRRAIDNELARRGVPIPKPLAATVFPPPTPTPSKGKAPKVPSPPRPTPPASRATAGRPAPSTSGHAPSAPNPWPLVGPRSLGPTPSNIPTNGAAALLLAVLAVIVIGAILLAVSSSKPEGSKGRPSIQNQVGSATTSQLPPTSQRSTRGPSAPPTATSDTGPQQDPGRGEENGIRSPAEDPRNLPQSKSPDSPTPAASSPTVRADIASRPDRFMPVPRAATGDTASVVTVDGLLALVEARIASNEVLATADALVAAVVLDGQPAYHVAHHHQGFFGEGTCVGILRFSRAGLAFESRDAGHSFNVRWVSVEEIREVEIGSRSERAAGLQVKVSISNDAKTMNFLSARAAISRDGITCTDCKARMYSFALAARRLKNQELERTATQRATASRGSPQPRQVESSAREVSSGELTLETRRVWSSVGALLDVGGPDAYLRAADALRNTLSAIVAFERRIGTDSTTRSLWEETIRRLNVEVIGACNEENRVNRERGAPTVPCPSKN